MSMQRLFVLGVPTVDAAALHARSRLGETGVAVDTDNSVWSLRSVLEERAAVQQHGDPAGIVRSLLPRSRATEAAPSAVGATATRWQLSEVVEGHAGWVHAIAVDPSNQFFVTGSGDTAIKVWDVETLAVRVTLAGHVMAVRAVACSQRHPYLFSGSEDKRVKNWDLERNAVVRDFHGHVLAVYSVDVHPRVDVIALGGRDQVVRVWDLRSRTPIHTIPGHTSTITNVRFQDLEPQLVSTAMDGTVRLYDLVAGKSVAVLAQHRRGVRALAIHPTEYSMATGSADAVVEWGFPSGEYLGECAGSGVVHSLSVAGDVLAAGGDNQLRFYSYTTGALLQESPAQASILTTAFDTTGTVLVAGCSDNHVRVWRHPP